MKVVFIKLIFMKAILASMSLLFAAHVAAIDLSNYAWTANPSEHFIVDSDYMVDFTRAHYRDPSGSCQHEGAHLNFLRPNAGRVRYVTVYSPVDGIMQYPPANNPIGTLSTPTGSVACDSIISNSSNLPKINLSIAFDDANGDSANFLLSLESQAVNASCSQLHLFKDAGASVNAGDLIALLPLVGDTHPDDRVPHIHFNLTVNGDSTKYCPNIFSERIANEFLARDRWPAPGTQASSCPSSFPGPTRAEDAFCYVPANDPADAVGN